MSSGDSNPARRSRAGRSVWPLLALGVAAFASGCAEHALFTLDVQLPEQTNAVSRRGAPTMLRHAVIQARPGALGLGEFDSAWGGFAETEPLALDAASPRRARWDVFITPRDVEGAVSVRVLLCAEPTCDDGRGDVERWYRIERAGYLGRATELPLSISAAELDQSDAAPRVVGRCQVRGCQAEEVSSYCQGDVGAHFCEL